MKSLKNRKMNDAEKDYQELRLLRQMLYLAEQQKTYGINDEKQYIEELKKIAGKVAALEVKYGINKN